MSSASKNPVKAAFRLVQQIWDQNVTVTACTPLDQHESFSFRYLDVIGNGTFGIVCRAQDLATDEIVAIKTVYQDEGHQNNEDFLSLVLEYMPTSLDRILKDFEKKHEAVPVSLIQALRYLHSLGICHRDIKPHNLLVDLAAQRVKLCDFGCSKRLVEGEPNIQYICARYYRAPEIVLGWAHYTCSIDVWSAGCVMAEMFTGKPLFPGKNSIDQLAKIVKVLGSPQPEELRAMGQSVRKSPAMSKALTSTRRSLEEHLVSVSITEGLSIPAEALDLLRELLRYDPAKRISAVNSLGHSFFKSLNSEMIYPKPIVQGNKTSLQPS